MLRRYFYRQTRRIRPTRPKAGITGFFKGLQERLTVTRVAFLLFGLPLMYYMYREVTRDVVIIDPISVPKRFEEQGLTSQVMANRLGVKLQEIERSVRTSLKKDVLGVGAAETAIPEVEIPGTKLGLKTVVDVARSVFGRHPKHIGGDIVSKDCGGEADEARAIKDPVCATAYFVQEHEGSQSLSDTADGSDASGVVEKLAELTLRQINPYILACYKEDEKEDLNKLYAAQSILEAITQDTSQDNLHRKAAFLVWGNTFMDEKKYDEAIKKFTKVIDLDPNYALAYNNWGNALIYEAHYEEATRKYAKVVELYPAYAYAYINWGIALMGERKYQKAITKFAEAVELDLKLAGAYRGIGNRGLALGLTVTDEATLEHALQKYANAAELDPKKFANDVEVNSSLADACRYWATALQRLGRQKEAEEKLAVAFKIPNR